MNAPPLSIPGTEECPICLVEVSSVKVLPCSHILCQPCLTTMTRSGGAFPCHVCRKICSDPKSAVTKFFGSLKCPSCLKLKDVDEFVWCKQCEKILCCRCVTKDHKFPNGHTMLDWSTRDAYEACFKSLTSPTEEIPDTEIVILLRLFPVAKEISEHLKSTRATQSRIMSELATSLGVNFDFPTRLTDKNGALFRSLATLVNLHSTPNLSVFGEPKDIKYPKRTAENIIKVMEFGPSTMTWKELTSNDHLDQNTAKRPKLAHQSSQNDADDLQRGQLSHSPSPSWDSQDSQTTNEVNIIQRDRDRESQKDAGPKYFGPISRRQEDMFLIGQWNVAFALIRENEFHLWSEFGQYECYSGVNSAISFIDGAIDGDSGLHVLSRDNEDRWFYSFCDGDGDENSIEISVANPRDVVDGVICCTDTGVPFLFLIEEGRPYHSVVYKFGKPKGTWHYTQAEEATIERHFKVSSASAVRQSYQEVLIFASDRREIRILRKRRQGSGVIIERWITLSTMDHCTMLPTAVYPDAFIVIKTRDRFDEEIVAYKVPRGNGEKVSFLWRKSISKNDCWLALGVNEKGTVGVEYKEDGDDDEPYDTYEMHYF